MCTTNNGGLLKVKIRDVYCGKCGVSSHCLWDNIFDVQQVTVISTIVVVLYSLPCCIFLHIPIQPASHSGHMNVSSDNCSQTGCWLEGNTSVGRK